MDILVVINTLGARFVETSLLRLLEVGNIPNVSDGVSRLPGANSVILIVLIVKEQILLILGIKDPALMGVSSTCIGSDGEDLRLLLVGDVVDSQCVFIVAVANFTAGIAGIWTLVE